MKQAKAIPMDHETRAMFERQFARHQELFGCKPGKRDMVFLDVASNEGLESLEKQTLDITLRANVDARLLYATMLCDRFVTEQNAKYLDPSELQEWDEAIAEADTLAESGVDVKEFVLRRTFPERYCEGMAIARDHITVLGYISHHRLSPKLSGDVRSVASAFISQARTCARLFRSASNEHYFDELISHCRTIFEIALRMEHIDRDVDLLHSTIALAGLRTGDFSYKVRPNGKRNPRTAVCRRSGREFNVHQSNIELAAKSHLKGMVAAYEQIYPMMSSVVHPDGGHAPWHKRKSLPAVHSFEMGFLFLNVSLNHLIAAILISGILPTTRFVHVAHALVALSGKIRNFANNMIMRESPILPSIEACDVLLQSVESYSVGLKP